MSIPGAQSKPARPSLKRCSLKDWLLSKPYPPILEDDALFNKVKNFAKKGNGRRLLNTLNKKDTILSPSQLDEIVKIYCDIGLPKEAELLKKQRGILGDEKYNELAKEVKRNSCSENYEAFRVSLRNLLTCGIKMNPAKMEDDNR